MPTDSLDLGVLGSWRKGCRAWTGHNVVYVQQRHINISGANENIFTCGFPKNKNKNQYSKS